MAAGATFTLAGNQPQLLRTLNNAATVTFTSASNFFINGGAFNNQAGAIFNIPGDADLAVGGAGTFSNAGTYRKSGGTGVSSTNVPFSNTGTVEVQSGTLQFSSNSTNTGATYNLSTGATVDFNSGTHTFDAASSLNGANGTAQLNATETFAGSYNVGTTNVTGGVATFNIGAGTVTLPVLNFSAGTLTGTNIINIPASGSFNWTNGVMAGSGVTNVAAGATFTLAGNQPQLLRTLNNAATVTFTSASNFFINGGAFNNQAGAVFNIPGDADLAVGGAGTFSNAGTYRKEWWDGVSSTNVPFSNTGTVEVQSGTLQFSSNSTNTGATYNLSTGATVDFNSGTHTFDAASSLNGANGTAQLNATETFAGSYNVGTTNVTGGVATFNIGAGTVTLPVLNFSAGTLTGTNIINIPASGSFNWTNGVMAGSGVTNVAAGATFTLAGNQPQLLRTLNNAATVTFTSASNFFINGGAFNNQAGAIFNIPGDADLVAAGAATFTNAGTYRKSAGTGISNNNVPFSNTGTVEVQSGTLSFSSTYTQTAGATILNGGNLSSGTILNIQGGELRGAGTITGSVNNAGTVRPGLSPGLLNITGSYTQTASGILEIEIGGAAAGTQFDQLNVGGVATLNGVLNTVLINGFSPINGASFQVLNYGSRSGTFSAVNGQFDANYNPTNLTLVLNAQAPTVFTVTNTNDNGPGSLRQAILDSNATPNRQTIVFQIPGGGVQTITPLSLLPSITDSVIVDGYTQPGASPNTLAVGNDAVLLIELNGASAIPPITAFDGLLVITAGNSTVRGLVINRFVPPNPNIIAGNGISLRTGGNNIVEGCFIGTDQTGTIAAP